MRIKYFVFVYFLLSLFCYAQSGKVVYIIKPDSIQNIADPVHKSRYLKMMEYGSQLRFELKFNKIQSVFKFIDGVDKEDFEYQVAQVAFGTNSDIYFDNLQHREISKTADGEIIEISNAIYNWEISSETKKIGDYECFMAILKIPYINRKGENKISEIIAWFAPSLPYSFGPKNYYGLPGLILELKDVRSTYLASSIDFLKEDLIINFPKGKTISKNDYEKRLKSQMGM